MRFWEKLLFTAGVRFDYQKDFTGLNTSAHGSLVWLANSIYTTRLSVSTAFNTPTFFTLFLNVANIPFGNFTASTQGNRDLKSEQVFYVDFSNTIRPLKWLSFNADVFYYRLKDLITPQLVLTSPTNFLLTYQNQGGVQAIGGELGVTAEVVEGLDLYANWAYEHMNPVLGNPYSTSNLGNPLNKVNAGLKYASDFGFFANLDFHWVQSHECQAGAVANFPNTPTVDLGDQFILNARVGYQPIKDHLEIAVIANNILDDNTPQIPAIDPVFNLPMAERPHFRLMGTVSYKF
jgi:outer membrane receptor protein involved in Fe transport